MKTPDEIKRGAELCVNGVDDGSCMKVCPYHGGEPGLYCFEALAKDCLSYIRQLEARLAEYEKPLKPMTWKEAILDDFYLELKGEAHVDMALNNFAMDAPNEAFIDLTIHGYEEMIPQRADYGKTWRAWSRRPTEEERKAAEWDD